MSPEDLKRALDRIQRAKKAELPALWAEYLPGPCPRNHILCRYGLAWQLQAREYGGPSANTKRRIAELSAAFSKDPNYIPPGIAPMKPGTEFTRHWKGVVHRVRVTTAGYEYLGQIYPNLSVIARRITGTQWSGPKFFGSRVEGRQPAK